MAKVSNNNGFNDDAQFDVIPLNDLINEDRDEESIISHQNTKDVLALDDRDPALAAKMLLVNDAIEQIGWTPYHLKLFFLNGFGYLVDSFLLLLQALIATTAYRELAGPGSDIYETSLNIAAYVGMLVGALFWGAAADAVGRCFAFNFTLLACAPVCIVAGAVPNWTALAACVALVGFAVGGNLVLDTTIFLEYLPGDKQWVVTFMAVWWGVGQAMAGLLGWIFLVKDEWNCQPEQPCPLYGNWGWRYVMFTSGSLVLALSLIRMAVISLKETPKYLIGTGDDVAVAKSLHSLAVKYNRPCSLTLEQLEACGVVRTARNREDNSSTNGNGHAPPSSSSLPQRIRSAVASIPRKTWGSLGTAGSHIAGLFATPRLGASTSLLFLSWTLIGLAYPLFYVFLPTYLEQRRASGALEYDDDPAGRRRNYALMNLAGIPGPLITGFLCNTPWLGRRYTMAIGAIVTAALFTGYTFVRTKAQDLGLAMAIGCGVNIYYGVLYAYTPEVLPTAHRATGNGLTVALNRVMGIVSSVVAQEADTSSQVPLYICASLFVALAIVSAFFPFEPYGKRSS